jgi:hypothetical protein
MVTIGHAAKILSHQVSPLMQGEKKPAPLMQAEKKALHSVIPSRARNLSSIQA